MAVYVMATEDMKYVKIGVSDDPHGRLKSLQTANPQELDILFTLNDDNVDADLAKEKALHEKFSDYRRSGEWFRVDGKLATWIRTHLDSTPEVKSLQDRITKLEKELSEERKKNSDIYDSLRNEWNYRYMVKDIVEKYLEHKYGKSLQTIEGILEE